MSKKLNRKDAKTLSDILGKQGIKLNEVEEINKNALPILLNVSSYRLQDNFEAGNSEWQVGFAVQYHGVGISSSNDIESTDSEAEQDIRQENEESSGFSSDPPSDAECHSRNSFSEESDEGQILYATKNSAGLYLNKKFQEVFSSFSNENSSVENENVHTKRFPVKRKYQPREVGNGNGYQMIGGIIEDVEISEDAKQDCVSSVDASSSGLWTNFVIRLQKNEIITSNDNLVQFQIPEEKSRTIPLDNEKIAKISKAMTGFSLPIPPGWENIDDKKLISFVNQRIS